MFFEHGSHPCNKPCVYCNILRKTESNQYIYIYLFIYLFPYICLVAVTSASPKANVMANELLNG